MHALCRTTSLCAFLPPVAKRGPHRVHHYESAAYREIQERFSQNLRRIRAVHEWTQEMAAERCGMTMQQFQAIESGDANVTFATLARVAAGLGVDVAVLVSAPVGS